MKGSQDLGGIGISGKADLNLMAFDIIFGDLRGEIFFRPSTDDFSGISTLSFFRKKMVRSIQAHETFGMKGSLIQVRRVGKFDHAVLGRMHEEKRFSHPIQSLKQVLRIQLVLKILT